VYQNDPEVLTALQNCVSVITLALANDVWGEDSTDDIDSRAEVESVRDAAAELLEKLRAAQEE
jgi:hypothetical protein